jgi:integrase/recombinase XerD
LREFLDYLHLVGGRSERTCDAYGRDLRFYLAFARDQQINKINEISPKIVGAYMASPAMQKKKSSSIARSLSAIKSFHGYRVITGRSPDNPARLMPGPRIGRKLPVVLTVPEVNRILAGPARLVPQERRDRAILEILYGAGLRISELAGLHIPDLLFSEQLVRVWGKGARERIVPISRSAIEAVEIYLTLGRPRYVGPRAGDFVFLSAHKRGLSRMGLWNIVRRWVKSAGIEKRVTPHTFRHTFATHLIEGGADLRAVQAMLGHESVTTTQIYTHLDRQYLREVHRSYHPLEQ